MNSANTKQNILLLLVGLKGAGKTFTGTLLEKHLNIKFLRIEPIFLEIMRSEPQLAGIDLEKRGFQTVLETLDDLAKTHPILCIESTGTAHTFPELLAALQQRFQVLLIQIQTPFETCIERVKNRETSVHIPVSDHRLREINEVALTVNLPWDLVIDNAEFQNEPAIVQAIEQLLARNRDILL
jgi:shikimate kinase